MRVKTPDGKIAEFPEGTQPDTVERALRAQFPPTVVTTKTEPVAESPLGIAAGAVKDTLGLGRTAADPLGRAVYDPKGAEHALLPMISAPAVVAGGVGAGAAAARAGFGRVAQAVAPALGRAGTQAAIGATRDVARSEAKDTGKEAAKGAITDGLTALLFEGLVPGVMRIPRPQFANVSRAAEPLLTREANFARATRAPIPAFEAIADRLKGVTRINVPTLGGKIAPDAAMKKLATLEGPEYQRALAELSEQMNALDTSGFGKKAGDLFLEMVSPTRFKPTGTAGEQAAKGALTASGKPEVRGAVDVTAASERERDVPTGPAALAGAGSTLGHIARRLLWSH